jgi:hypothetical protein
VEYRGMPSAMARQLAVRNAHADPNSEHIKTVQHVPIFEVLIVFCFSDRCRRVETQDFQLLSDSRFGQLGAAAWTAQHQQHTKNSIVSFSLQYYMFS